MKVEDLRKKIERQHREEQAIKDLAELEEQAYLGGGKRDGRDNRDNRDNRGYVGK